MSNNQPVFLTDCPRDAIQGMDKFIPTAKKITYLNALIGSALFDFIDFGSFVSAKAVPQLRDTEQVIESIEKSASTKLIAIIANERGASMGAGFKKIDYLGYPFSVSDTFQRRNTNRSIEESFTSVRAIKDILDKSVGPELMVYISMAFGNPYQDPWHEDIVLGWMERLKGLGVRKFSIADTTSAATAEQIGILFNRIYAQFSDLELSIHLHSDARGAAQKIEAAFQGGCRIFEGAVLGYGGCPFAQDELVGNIPSELLIHKFKSSQQYKVQSIITNFNDMIYDAV
ncbi:MAG: hydroxymethylglutaryl-CoA lyase [Sphingobacterium sp.]|uniref:hypothetical protein n=1 Tax=Sphingobacterium sp. JB170 TaxID=1434842 RepID=UPI00097F33E2|nr:hypothetical protein [Sphingobacterium sp. JB170]SJN21679.1 Hydroxymethylglutaryl-CoA lyase [Sphingobacterium sp. JB170]